MMGEVDVGFYDAAYRLVNISSLGVGFYIIAVRPTIFRLYKSSFEKFQFACKESIRYLYILILPIIVGISILGDRFILTIFTSEFLPSAIVLNILIWLLLFNGINQILASSLISSDNQIVNLKANILGMILNIVLCLLLIPKLSYIGAGIATTAAAFLTSVYQYSISSNILFKIPFFNLAKKTIVSSLCMGIVVFFLKDINLIILILLSIIAYIIISLILRVFQANDMILFKEMWFSQQKISTPKI
jgi:O-antigen/teichoic acid export membrane protein